MPGRHSIEENFYDSKHQPSQWAELNRIFFDNDEVDVSLVWLAERLKVHAGLAEVSKGSRDLMYKTNLTFLTGDTIKLIGTSSKKNISLHYSFRMSLYLR